MALEKEKKVSKELKEQFVIISNDFDEKFFNIDEPKICELHDLLDQGSKNHNCIACNLASNYLLIQNHLSNGKHFEDFAYAYSNTILLYYLLVEKFFAIFSSIEKAGLQPEGYKNSHETMRRIWAWANFLKHPKAFMYVHDPKYLDISTHILEIIPESEQSVDDTSETTTLIDDDFVKKFYMGGKNNLDLYNQLKNKTNVLVVFPNLEDINEGLKIEINTFETLVKTNLDIVNHLHQEATIIEFWDEDE